MGLQKANNSEAIIFYRLASNKRDPGTQLLYKIRLTGALVPSDLNLALRELLAFHYPDAMNYFFEKSGLLFKKWNRVPEVVLEYVEESAGGSPEGISGITHSMLPANRLFRFTLIKTSNNCYDLLLIFSHLFFDGECYRPFFNLLSSLYARIAAGDRVPRIKPGPGAEFDEPNGENQPSDATTRFWKDRLTKHALGQRLTFLKSCTTDYCRFFTARRTMTGDNYRALREFIAASDTTLFRVVVAACAVTVLKYGSNEDYPEGIAVAHTVSSRRHRDMLGCFFNVVPLFVPARADWTLRDYLSHINSERDAIRAHQFIPPKLLVSLSDERHGRGNPILNLVVNQSTGLLPITAPEMAGLVAELVETPATGGPFDLGITFNFDEAGLYLSVDVPEERASQCLVSEFADNLLKVIALFSESPDQEIGAMDLHPPLRPVLCGDVCELPTDESLTAQILKWADQTPQKVAVIDSYGELTFAQLVANAIALAHRVTDAADDGDLAHGIGLQLGRSNRLPVAMLAALLLKVPFVPLEESLPPERLGYILSTTRIMVVINDGSTDCSYLKEAYPQISVIDISHAMDITDQTARELPVRDSILNDLAYILFTSGSTGDPKGVQLTRRNLLNFMLSMEHEPGICHTDHVLALTPISFDISILELMLPLFVGGTLEILDDEVRQSAVDLGKRINSSAATVVQATPSTWRMLKNGGWFGSRSLTLLCGGEALPPPLAEYLLSQGHVLYNMYGPTEATIWSSCERVSEFDQIYLGKPVLNTQYYIVDGSLRALPTGQAGELLIHGACVGAGYVNQNAPKAFINIEGIEGLVYRTGDIVRSFGDGQITYLGRNDNQLKVNGHRIELDEITCRIRALASGIDVFTVVCEFPAWHLCSFYYAAPDFQVDEERILAGLRRALPTYMVPTALIRLSSIPLTPSGKVDLKSLATKLRHPSDAPVPKVCNVNNVNHHYADEPITLREVRAIVLDVLGVELQDPDMSMGRFGLNSISYNLLSQALQTQLAVSIPPHRFFTLNTLATVSREVEKLRHRWAGMPQPPAHGNGTVQLREPIAIVGYSVLMPQNLEANELWVAMLQKRNLVSKQVRRGFQAPLHAGFLDDIEGFDAQFFSISPLEANHMDPRQRLLLQVAWRAIEDAGYAPGDLRKRKIGCYIGATGADYATLQARAGSAINPYSLPGSSLSILANRLSSYFDWKGPSFTLDTACSGSLSAIAKACNDLLSGVCEEALVGGINIIADDQISRGLEAGNFMSKHFRCAAFDESADGYVRGEGAGCFLLKPLSRAIESGDAIHGLILAHGENHGGHANSLTAPNAEAQAALLIDTYTPELARKVSYIETHGTGTKLGDPIEIDALKSAWKRLCGDSTGRTVWLGALKSNIGHLEPASGVASLAKVLLAIRHRTLPPNNHFNRLNQFISLENSPFSVLDATRHWTSDGQRVAGINSFGFGGANAHIVVGEPPPDRVGGTSRPCYIVTLSARSEFSLAESKDQLQAFVSDRLMTGNCLDLESLAYTLNVGRQHFKFRTAWVVRCIEDLSQQLAIPLVIRKASRPPQVFAPLPTSGEDERFEQLIRLKEDYLDGCGVDWSALHAGEHCLRMHLPTYRFEKLQYWFDRTRPVHSMQN